MVERARSLGYSDAEILQAARDQGYVDSTPKTQDLKKEEMDSDFTKPKAVRTKEVVKWDSSKYFGYNLFNPTTRTLSFETNLLIPTPDDYVLGPQDQLTINVFGASERNYTLEVKSSGAILLPNVGPVGVSGLTLKKVEIAIKRRLSLVYPDLLTGSPNTYVEVTVTRIRTLKVNMVGELKMPGTYTVNGLSTVFNALYVAGGPSEIGTLRDIKVYRNNELLSTVDIYEFLVNGVTNTNVRLQNDDVILVGPYLNRLELKGEVKRPGIFEMKAGETISDVMTFSGGFNEFANTEKVKLSRITNSSIQIADIFSDQLNLFETKSGDVIEVGRFIERYENRIQIGGSVYRPGSYGLTTNMTIKDLIERAGGLHQDSYLNKALLTRITADMGSEILSVDLNSVMSGGPENIELREEDRLEVLSIYDLEEEMLVKISGEVNAEGVYRYSEGMTVSDLIFLANGYKASAKKSNVEIARKPENQSRTNQRELIIEDLSAMESDGILLRPSDHIIVRRDPTYFPERSVEILGEVSHPGKYVLQSEDDRISDVLSRMDGFGESAYLEGVTLIRKTEFFTDNLEKTNRNQDLIEVINSLDSTQLSQSDLLYIEQAMKELEEGSSNFSGENLATEAKKQRLIELANKNPSLTDIRIRESESIPLDIKEIIRKPGSNEDLKLEDGDIISVPKKLETVRVRGRVLFPNTVRFESGQSLRYFVGKSGGFDSRANRSKSYVVYPNGEVAQTRRFLFFKKFPEIQPGSEIIVPIKPIKIPVAPSEIVGLTTGLATLALIVNQILTNP